MSGNQNKPEWLKELDRITSENFKDSHPHLFNKDGEFIGDFFGKPPYTGYRNHEGVGIHEEDLINASTPRA